MAFACISVYDEILQWSRSRPEWQRDALRRLVVNARLEPADIEDLLLLCKIAHGIVAPPSPEKVPIPLDETHVCAEEETKPVAITSISQVNNVNAIVSPNPLTFQDEVLALEKGILGCAHYRENGDCWKDLPDVSKGVYKHGPEIAFVGEKYGLQGTPRILFTRLNPTWNQDIGWFGTRESLAEYRLQNPDAKAKDIFQCYLKGWSNGGKVFRGMWDAGTVTGHPNKSRLPGAVKRESPRYGIQTIMEEMLLAGVFPCVDDSPLEFCAINNAVKCAGSLPKWNPSTSMYRNCDYYEKELEILAPHILVAFGNDTDGYLRAKLHNRFLRDGSRTTVVLQNGASCRYFLFLHPLGLGKNTWRGEDVRHLTPDIDVDRNLGQKEEEQFKSGPSGSSTSTLFKYTLYLVSQAKRVKESIAVP